jgi:hypothetical protein
MVNSRAIGATEAFSMGVGLVADPQTVVSLMGDYYILFIALSIRLEFTFYSKLACTKEAIQSI